MLAEPNDESAANVAAAKMWREDRAQFERIADKLVDLTLHSFYPQSELCAGATYARSSTASAEG